jgi:hypothetical protein
MLSQCATVHFIFCISLLFYVSDGFHICVTPNRALTRSRLYDLNKGTNRALTHSRLYAENKKSTKFDRVLDDFVGKRYGAGEAFYGKRKSALSEEDFQALRQERQPKQDEIVQNLKNNALLVVGGLSDISQWVMFDLLEKGFNIRVAATNKKKAVDVIGLDGCNADIVEMDTVSPSIDEFEYLLKGVQAIIISDSFIGGNGRGQQPDDCILAQRMIKYLGEVEKKRGVKDTLKKIVLISHAGGYKGGKGAAAKLLSAIFSPFSSDVEGGPNEQVGVRHASLEDSIRGLAYDYVIVRAPPTVQRIRDCGEVDLELVQVESDTSFESPGTGVAGAVGLLDLAEVAVQATIQDFSGITFAVREVDSGAGGDGDQPLVRSVAMEAQYGESPVRVRGADERVPRPSYYNILDMGDREMKFSYLLRDTQVLKDEISEDQMVERYWADKFSRLALD